MEVRQVSEYPSEPPLVAEPFRQRARLAQDPG
jgi:hypothetical protein